MALPSYPIRVQVLSHDPENDGVYVMTPSGQILPLVHRLYDHADGLRIKKPPLPVRGSWGLVQFPGGDIRNGFWMGAFHPNLVDSLPNDASDPFSDYESNFDGSWSHRHGISGFWGQQWADNSSFVMGTSGLNLPDVHRHTVTSGQARQRVLYPQSERNPNPQKPFGWAYQQAASGGSTGLGISCDSSGNFTMSGSGTFTVKFNEMTIVISTSGISISASGSLPIALTAQTTLVKGNLHSTGAVIAGFGSDNQVNLQSHLTTGVQTGTSDSGPPKANS